MGRKRVKPLVVRKNPIEVANKVIDMVREQSPDCIVMMSLGKDSIVTLDLLYDKFERIVCIYVSRKRLGTYTAMDKLAEGKIPEDRVRANSALEYYIQSSLWGVLCTEPKGKGT